MLRIECAENWHLRIMRDARGGDGAGYRWRDLTWARHVDVAPPLEITIAKRGIERDITLDIGAGAPILSTRAATVIRSLGFDDVELLPAVLEGRKDEYFVMNVLSVVKCVDEDRTQYVEKWTNDSYRADRTGEYKRLMGIVIHPSLATGRNLFRIWGSFAASIIVSRAMKEALEQNDVTGVRFRDVCSPKSA
jgi:hypothetical protein